MTAKIVREGRMMISNQRDSTMDSKRMICSKDDDEAATKRMEHSFCRREREQGVEKTGG